MSEQPDPPDRANGVNGIEWVAFDLGGVLFAEGTGAFVSTFPEDQRDLVDEILRNPFSKDLRRGLVAESVFWSAVADKLPPGWDVERFRTAWYDCYELDVAMQNLVRSLHGRVRLAVFSGNIASRVRYLDEKYDFRRYFEREIYSYDHGSTKPDPAFVDVLLRELNCTPQRIAYIDDKQSALDPALARGVEGILYRSGDTANVTRRLTSLGVLPQED